MIQKRTQLSVIAVAALAIVAVAAVMLLAGGNPAQATTATLAPDGGGGHPSPQQTDPTPTPPRHAAPEPCPGEAGNPNKEAARVVDSGHIALFDVWWNTVELELTNSSCPPTITHVPADEGEETPARDDRAASNIDIDKTIIHIPNSAKVDLSTSTTYTKAKYKDVWDADAKENRDTNNDGTPDGVGDGIVWALPACPPDGILEADGLCLSFSAALLKQADWQDKIEYHLDHVHQIDIDKQDPRYTLAYNVPEDGADTPYKPLWNSSNARVATMSVEPGGYGRPMWFFTSRGTYEFQVHIRGNPDQTKASERSDGLKPVSNDKSVTSDMREYILHIGAEADLGVAMKVAPADSSDSSLDPGDDVSITITASNVEGPDTATNTKVEVTLPKGLTHSSHTAATGTSYDSAAGTWTIGDLAKGASKTLIITATVDAGTHGKALTSQVTISATEPVKITETEDGEETEKTYQLPVLDDDPSNDMISVTVTVAGSANVDPIFRMQRSVAENLPTGTLVGAPIAAFDQNGDKLTYSLSGDHSAKFRVDGQGQISLSECGVLDYETQSSYALTLSVSDGKDHSGNDDPTVDGTIGVLVQVTDVDDATQPRPAAGLRLSPSSRSLSLNDQLTLTVGPFNLPSCEPPLDYLWHEQDPADTGTWTSTQAYTPTTMQVTHGSQGSRLYSVESSYLDSDGNLQRLRSNNVVVNWQ